MNNRVIFKTQIPAEDIEAFANVLQWFQNYVDCLEESIINPDMDDEIVLVTCEGEILENFEVLTQLSQDFLIGIIDEIFDYTSDTRFKLFTYHLSKMYELAEAA